MEDIKLYMFPNSSNLESMTYDKNKNLLNITFKGGGIYEYYKVPYSEYLGLKNAESAGKHFHKHIKYSFEFKNITNQ